jgi:23S rRNA pseudouridine1911/1915/1917 synthase
MSRRTVEFAAGATEAGVRLDAALAERVGVSRTVAARLISDGDVTVDGRPAAKSLRLEQGMTVRAAVPEHDVAPAPEEIPVHVVYEDDSLFVISKPAGLVVHPAPGHPAGTLVNALVARGAAGGSTERPGIVHRLDAGTSGLMIVTKKQEAYEALTRAMAERRVSRVYMVLVEGIHEHDTATIDAPIGRSPKHRTKMAVVAGGRPAVTNVTVLERLSATTLLEAKPVTGRTHQIRVHLAAAGYPVAGDPLYGKDRSLAAGLGLDRPFLHAAALSFEHPASGVVLELNDPLPTDLIAVLERAR